MAVRSGMTGALEMEKRIKGIAQNYPKRVEAGAYYEFGIECTEAKRRCPVYVGAPNKNIIPGLLRSTGQVHRPEWHGKTVTCVISFGAGGAEDYAIVQHERLDYFHTVGQAKYLESVLNESHPYMAGRIAQHASLNNENMAPAPVVGD